MNDEGWNDEFIIPSIRFDFQEDGVILFADGINFFPKLITRLLINCH